MNYLTKTLLLTLTLTLGACMKSQTFEQSFAAYERKDYEMALTGFRKLSEQGDAKAQYQLGAMYHDGQGVPKDEQKATTWYRKSAELGNAEAQYMLGALYQTGRGLTKDQQQAVTWYRKAADQGNIDAQFNLAALYLAGQEIPKDEQQAVTWYRKAAEQGHTVAQLTLGGLYAFGTGVPADIEMAYFWLLLASRQGDQKTIEARDTLRDALSPDQRTAVQALATNWVPKKTVPPAQVADTAKNPVTPKEAAPAQPIPGTTSIDTKFIALCAAETSTIKRLACFDEVAKTNGLAPKNKETLTTSSGKWRTSSDSDPLTDKAVHFAFLNADEGVDRSGTPYILIIRCKNSRTELFVNWNTYLGTNDVAVTSRIDKNAALTADWDISNDSKASFMPQSVTTLKKFEGASKFLVNLTPYGENPVTAVFDINGSLDALKIIRRDCKW